MDIIQEERRVYVGFIRKTEVGLYEYYFGEKNKFYVVSIVEKELVCIENIWRERVFVLILFGEKIWVYNDDIYRGRDS